MTPLLLLLTIARLRALDHRSDTLRVEWLTVLVAVTGVRKPCADLAKAEALAALGTCPPQTLG